MKKEPVGGLKATTNNSPSSPATEHRNYKSNSKKVSNKSFCCPFRCPNCESLEEYVSSRYEISNIIEDNSRLIVEPFGRV
jgi:hypothetical protein